MNHMNDTLFGHPKGLFLLFSTELWERFSYYAMRGILVLYLTDHTLDSGLGWTERDALELYGIFTGLMYFTPLIGGWIADNYLGQRRSIIIGGLAMAAGQFTLALPNDMVGEHANQLFYLGLAILTAGNGLFKPNISTMVSELYQDGDNRRDGAFTIFYMGINIGSLLAGIIAGTASAHYGWKAGFFCAGIGMVTSVIIQFTCANRYLGDIGKKPAAARARDAVKSETNVPLTKEDIDRIKVFIFMGLFVVVFWAGFEQAGGLMNLYAHDYTDRVIGDFVVPATWFQSLNPFFVIILSPIIAGIWSNLGDRNPSSPVKFALALFFVALGFACMMGAALEQHGDDTIKTSMGWLVGAYFFHTIGELCLSPIGLSLATKLAPLRLASMMMGVWFGFNAVANYLSGLIGSHITEHGPMAIFAGITLAATISGIILLIFSNQLIYWMHGVEKPYREKQNHHSYRITDS